MSPAGNVGIGTSTPNYLLQVGKDGAWCDGNVWHDVSSRERKDHIRDLSAEDALSALEQLRPTRFYYKSIRDDEHLGFIAEDVPELVASKDRKGLSAMDFVAVLTKVTQEQHRTIAEQQRTIREQQRTVELQQRRIATLDERLRRIEERLGL
ncbi:MAG: tail fiber domain-containing protein [Deltaproteobacteria bacterium]|nr:tail fiber domain-containing protein [Deltaproteobacteria bacterium]